MGTWEIITIICAVLIVAAVIAGSVIRKKKSKGSVCSDCSCCPYNSSCKTNKKES